MGLVGCASWAVCLLFALLLSYPPHSPHAAHAPDPVPPSAPALQPHHPEELAKLQRDVRLRGLDLVPCATLLQALTAVLGDVGGGRSKQGGGKVGAAVRVCVRVRVHACTAR